MEETRGHGEIGKRSGLKIHRRKACGFDSHCPHYYYMKILQLLAWLYLRIKHGKQAAKDYKP